jgi:hypothetical protein
MDDEKVGVEDAEDMGIEVEIESTDTDEDRSTEKLQRTSEEGGEGDELDNYSQKVQGRIKKLTEKYRKEERDREEAVRMAQQLMNENHQLKSRMQNLDKGYLNEYGTRLEAQQATLKRVYREAYDSGDTEKMLEAQDGLSKMSIEQERLRIAKQRSERVEVERAAPQQQVQQQQVQQQQAAPLVKTDPRAESWAGNNDWFGSDEVMTYAAFGIHRKLVEEEGFDPETDEYYTEVDRRMRSEFPHRFKSGKKTGGAQVAPAGASATRSTAKQGRRSVKLSPSQIAMAKRLNVPLEEYAKYVKD